MRGWRILLACGLALLLHPAQAEYGDVVMNKRSEALGQRPVVFSHWFHRIRYQCRVCHAEQGFKMRAGTNDVQMADIAAGRFCGSCHNGEIVWAADRCELCHSGLPGKKSGVIGGDRTMGPGRF